MIDKCQFDALTSFFDKYTSSFTSDDPDFQRNITLKIDHTKRVVKEIADLGKSLNLSQEDLRLAKIIAYFHDIGRFQQYKTYETYSDAKSENHAMLGVRILKQNHVLDSLSQVDRDLIINAIANHNRASLAKNESERVLFFSKLIRDADKIDIFKVVTDYYAMKRHSKHAINKTIELDLPDNSSISRKVSEAVLSGEIVKSGDLNSVNDFKLLQMAWIFDLNFQHSFEVIAQRKFIEKIYATLPHNEKINQIFQKVMNFLKDHRTLNLIENVA
ncbi:MAG: HD domain-containing protein [Promethearchaeota archaeon]